ncbi:MAG: prepilin-type N-terminal cleavage/methylation domain-containing protein, partial [Verrucomicrobiaceae bacterium]
MRMLTRRSRHAAFTLLEIMIAVMIVAMMMFTVYRFVQS